MDPPGPDGRQKPKFDVDNNCGWLTRMLLRIGGFHRPWIDNNSDASKLAAQAGILILVPTIAFGGVLASAWAVNVGHRFNYWFIWVLAAVWALFVFCVDRWIMTSIDYGDLLVGPQNWLRRAWRSAWFYLARIGMAVVVGYVISESVALGMFNTAIERELPSIQSDNLTDYKASIGAEYDTAIADAKDARTAAENARDIANSTRETAQADWQDERRGTGGTLDAGDSPPSANCLLPSDPREICAESNRRYVYNQADTTAITSQQKALEAQDLVRTLESTRQTRIDEKAAKYEAVNAADTNAVTRHRALVRLIGDDLGYRWFYIVIIVTLLVVDLTPLLLKLFGPHTPYLENARRDAARLRARTTVQVIEGAKGEADAQYDLDDRKHRNRANTVAHAGDLDEREHRNRMDSLTREHEHTLADAAAKHAVAQTREALHKLSDDSAAAKDLADHYLKTAFAHLKERRHRPRATPTQPYTQQHPRNAQQGEQQPDDLSGETPTPTPQPPQTPQPQPPPAPAPAPRASNHRPPAASPRDEYGLEIGNVFPDDTVDNPLDRHWRITKFWRHVNGGSLLLAVDEDSPDNGIEYVIKVYLPDRSWKLRKRDRAQGLAELDAVPALGVSINDAVADVYFSDIYQDQMVIVTRRYPHTLNTFQDARINGNEPGGFDLALVLQIAERLLSALAWSWTKREKGARAYLDMKPPNICIDNDGTPKIIDWALSRSLDEAAHTSSRLRLQSLFYSPPEQGSAGQLWPTHLVAADIYAWAATLYEMITGKPPYLYEAEQQGITLNDFQNGNPRAERALDSYRRLRSGPLTPVSKFAPFVPEGLDNLLRRCLDPAPERRHVVPTDNSFDARVKAAERSADQLIRWLRLVKQDALHVDAGGAIPAAQQVGNFTRFKKPPKQQQQQDVIGNAGHLVQQQHQPRTPHPDSVPTDDPPYLPPDNDPDAPRSPAINR
ncbi:MULTISPECIES: DUF4407 domain-containing protein [Nocardiaceae]|nr:MULTISPECIES: DUF4407 domain-containing protein [Rhodococcus]